MTDVIKAEMMTEGEFLEHFGKKGMKWGVRKDGGTPSSHVSADAARTKKIEARVKKHGTDNLSNDDLAKLNKRNQLMSEYKKNNPTKLKMGAEATHKALKTAKTVGGVAVAALAISAALKSPAARVGAEAVAAALKGL